jgi:lambda repressor-like predicted transcriptional regulator
MITDIEKSKFLGKLGANLPKQVSLPVVHAIVSHLDPILGVASARYEKYAEVSATGLRTVTRTIPVLHRHGLLRKQSRRNGPPVLWLPEIMDMQADEAVERAGWLACHKDENPQNFFRAGRAHARRTSERARDEIDEGELRQQRRAKAASPAHANDQEILRLVHSEWDAQGLTPEDPKALTKAIHATGKSRPERLKHLDVRALRKSYQRARDRLPVGYDRWIGLVEKWDKAYNRQKARDLVERLITAVGDRPRRILDRMFHHLTQQICDHLPKKVRRLEYECERLGKDDCYVPDLRRLKTDAIKEQVYAALADGPKTKRQLAQMFRKPYGAISSVGLRLRNEGQITTIWRGGQFMWARASTAPRFIPARDAIVAALKKGPMTIPALARDTGKGTSTVKCALHRHLLANGTVIRTKLGTYALAGAAPRYVSNSDAIVAALKNGPMTYQALAREVSTPSSIPQFLGFLLAKGTIIRTKRGVYALPGSASVYVPTSDAIISALRKKAMKVGPLVQHVNKLTTSARSRGTITSVLRGLEKQGTVKQEQKYGEYRLVRRVHLMRRGESVRRKEI